MLRKLSVSLVMLALVLVGCEREQSETKQVNPPTQVPKFKQSSCHLNPSNPYDSRGIGARKLLDSVLAQPVSNSNRDSFESNLSDATGNLNWNIDDSISTSELSFMRDFVELYGEYANSPDIFYQKIISLEDSVVQSITDEETKETILTSASITRNMYFFVHSNDLFVKDMSGNQFPMARPAYTQCLDDQLSNIFVSDGNPIPEAAFIAGLPGSWLTITAYCAWDVMLGIPDIPLGSVIYIVNQERSSEEYNCN
ncbi:MAG: hypothetical protein RI842_10485 [Schleiferiaceae bacterium]|nr:hypothetical protein [Schleiferiaceae bacterium]